MDDRNFTNLGKTDFVKFVISDFETYQEALFVMKRLKINGCLAQFAFSPVYGQLDINDLMEWISKDAFRDITINCQLHKLLKIKEKK